MAGQEHDEFAELERQLAALKPQASRLDRAELLFRAGQESARARRFEPALSPRIWQLSTALLAVIALGLAWRIHNLRPETVERIKYVEVFADASLADRSDTSEESPQPARAEEAITVPREHYVQQRRVAVELGLDGLGEPWSNRQTYHTNLFNYRDLKANYFEQSGPDKGATSHSEADQQL